MDADWAGDNTDRKSISGHVFRIGDACVGWSCKKQATVALSSTEAEFIAAAIVTQEAVWMRMLLKDVGYKQKQPTTIFEDNQSCIKFIQNEKAAGRIKHLNVKRSFIRDVMEKGEVSVDYCPSEDNIADILTKPVPAGNFKNFASRIGLDFT